MPRTKLPKVAASKRAREQTSELDDILRDFDVEFENSLQAMRNSHQKNLQDAESEIENFKAELDPNVLLKTMGEVKLMKSLTDSAEKTIHNLNMTVKDTIQKPDEGYLTADVGCKSSESECDKSVKGGNVSIIAPLRTIKSRRRSQSASNVPIMTPGPRSMMNQMKQKTPLPSSHASRSKFRTPATQKPMHQRAASADRVDTIIPKINAMTPVSILRHPRSGEVAFSVKGSPILTSNVVERVANVNIPVANGILSVRPECMDPAHLNESLINKIDPNTISHLHTLKNNLDILMKVFDRKNKC